MGHPVVQQLDLPQVGAADNGGATGILLGQFFKLTEQPDESVHTLAVRPNHRQTVDDLCLYVETDLVEGIVAEQLVIVGTDPDMKLLAEIGADGQHLGALNPGHTAGLHRKLLAVDDENALAFPHQNEITIDLQHREHFLTDGIFLQLQVFVGPAEDIASGCLAQWPAFLFHALTPMEYCFIETECSVWKKNVLP